MLGTGRSSRNMDDDLISKVKAALLESWSEETCIIYEGGYPYYGQCAQTSIVIHEIFGGDILQTRGWPRNGGGNGRHFYNQIEGKRFDFTAEQFTDIPDYTYDVVYQDIPSSIEEAQSETSPSQIRALKAAFETAMNNWQRSNA